MSNDHIQLKSTRDLASLVEVFLDNNTFKFTTFTYFDQDGVAYFGELPTRKKQISLQLFQENLKPVPDEDIYPTLPSHVTVAGILPGDDIYIKRPKLSTYDNLKGQNLLATLLLQEVETMELLRNHPHPHIVRYHGCTVKGGRITGIALDRYPQTLERRLEDRERELDTDSCFQSIVSAIEHLHSLGLAHNDINPVNIMVDQEDTPFLIDFGSCQPFGADLITCGTPGWMEDYFMTSAKSHDEFSLGKLKSWFVEVLAGTFQKPPYPDPEPLLTNGTGVKPGIGS